MIEKLECTCIEAYTVRKMRDPNCCACSCDHNDLVEQLAKANERVRELELVIVAITHADETGYVDDVGFVQGWSEVCDETKSLINKFAIENQIKGAFSFANYLDKSNFSAAIAAKESGFFQLVETFGQQLRKEQDK